MSPGFDLICRGTGLREIIKWDWSLLVKENHLFNSIIWSIRRHVVEKCWCENTKGVWANWAGWCWVRDPIKIKVSLPLLMLLSIYSRWVVYSCVSVKVWEVYFWIISLGWGQKPTSVWFNLLVYLCVPVTLLLAVYCGSACVFSVFVFIFYNTMLFFSPP